MSERSFSIQADDWYGDNSQFVVSKGVQKSPCLCRPETGEPCQYKDQDKNLEPCANNCNAKRGLPENQLTITMFKTYKNIKKEETIKCKFPGCTKYANKKTGYCSKCGKLVRNRRNHMFHKNGFYPSIEILHAPKHKGKMLL